MHDDDKYDLTQFHGGKDRVSASRLQNRIGDSDGFRTAMNVLADRTEILQTKGGMPQWRVEYNDNVSEPIGSVINRGFIEQSTSFYHDGSAYQYQISDPVLAHYQNASWFAKEKKFKRGSASYCVITTTDRISGAAIDDLHFFDVAHYREVEGKVYLDLCATKSGKSFFVSLMNGSALDKTKIPYILPCVSFNPYRTTFPTLAADDASDFHVFQVSKASVSHMAGRSSLKDAEYDVTEFVSTSTPLLSDPAGASFGIDSTVDRVTFFGTKFTTQNADYLSIYNWYATVGVSRSSPYISTYDLAQVTARQYRHYIDVLTTATRTFNTEQSPIETPSDVPRSVPVYDLILVSNELAWIDYENHLKYSYSVRSHVGEVSGSLKPYGTTYVASFSNSLVPYDSTSFIGCQIGKATLRHKTTLNIGYERRSGNAFFNYDAHNETGAPLFVADFGTTVPAGALLPASWGRATGDKYTNNSAFSVNYTIDFPNGESAEMFSSSGSFSYTYNLYVHSGLYAGHVAVGRQAALQTSGPALAGRESEDLPPPRLQAIYLNNSYATVSQTGEVRGDSYTESSSVTISCRDYIYHDIINGVSIYIKLDCSGSNVSSSGIVSVVVSVKGVEHSFELVNFSGTGHRITKITEDCYPDALYLPTYLPPPCNPAFYNPACEQGDFKYIAYTTKAEDTAGVAQRFMLSLPLSIARFNDTIYVDPAPETPCHLFTAHNLTAAAKNIAGDIFTPLLGKVYHIHVSHDGKRDWLVDLKVVGNDQHHFAEVYRV